MAAIAVAEDSIARQAVAIDYCRHSGRRCFCLHVGVVGRIQTRSTSCVLEAVAMLDAAIALKQSGNFLDRRHSGRSHYRIECCRIYDDRRHRR